MAMIINGTKKVRNNYRMNYEISRKGIEEKIICKTKEEADRVLEYVKNFTDKEFKDYAEYLKHIEYFVNGNEE